MPTLKVITSQAQKLISGSDIKDLLLPLWRLIEFQAHAESSPEGVVLCRKGDAVIHLYPTLANQSDAPVKIVKEFGKFVLLRAGDRGASVWKNKLDLPTKEQIETIKNKLADPDIRTRCRTYKDVLDTYPTKGGSADRLVYINVMNALLANNIAFSDSVGVDIMAWGPTAEYCNRRKYHCLIPLVSAYAPEDVYNEFGAALAALCVDSLGRVRDSSVAYALRGIVQRIARMASPA